jgi:hypothetical protein
VVLDQYSSFLDGEFYAVASSDMGLLFDSDFAGA